MRGSARFVVVEAAAGMAGLLGTGALLLLLLLLALSPLGTRLMPA